MQDIVVRLITRENSDTSTQSESVIAACEKAYVALAHWVGADGCHALFARALAEARSDFPALSSIELNPGGKSYISGVAGFLKKNNDDALAEGMESVLLRVFTLLSRLIGKDVADKLIEQSFPEKG